MSELYRDREIEDLGVEYAKDLLAKYNLSYKEHQELVQYCNSIGIEYMCTPWDTQSVEHLEKLEVKRYKIASADFDNIPLLECVARTGKPMLLSTGMNSTAEIEEISRLLHSWGADFTLLHCNSTYPAPFIDIELNYIKKLQKIHPKVGYSGHERGIAVSVAAVALGATVIERHVTLDKDLEGPDHQASLLPDEIKTLSQMISEVEVALGKPNIVERKLSQGALLNKENLGKSIVTSRPLKAGTCIQREDIDIRSPGQGLPPSKIKLILGQEINVNLKKHDFIHEEHFTVNNETISVDNLKMNWGVPVRPHDIIQFHNKFDAPVYEFHVSYNDLKRRDLPSDLKQLTGRKILVHAPELFSESMLLDLCAPDNLTREKSIKNLQSVCDYCSELAKIVNAKTKIQIIANVGGFSTHSFRDPSVKAGLYADIADAILGLDQPHSEIIPQNMAPFPWHFGGQRYQNVFMVPEEILDYCNTHSTRICLDTAHLSMYCNFSNRDFQECLNLILPVTAHLHMSDAKGVNGEGVMMGTGDVDFGLVLMSLTSANTFIVETWQGHKNLGAGFVKELSYLNKLGKIS